MADTARVPERYVLNKRYRLRGYEKLPTGLFDTEIMDTTFFDEDRYRILLNCDGVHGFDLGGEREADELFIQELLEKEIIHPAVFGEMLLPEQMYRKYPTEYRSRCQWSITGECNFRCRHCFMSAPHNKHGAPSWDQLVDIADQLGECGVHTVGITGGEPLVREDFINLLGLLREREIGVATIFTNGWMVDEALLDALDDLSLHPGFQLSFDGIGHHDFLRGVNGAEEKTLQVLELLAARDHRVSVSMCLHRGNLASVRDTVNKMAGLGVMSMKISPAMDLGEWSGAEVQELRLDKSEFWKAVCAYIPQFFEDGALLNIEMDGCFAFDKTKNTWNTHAIAHCSHDDEASMASCGLLLKDFFVSASGRVVPCMAMDESAFAERFPNLFEKPLKQILVDPDFKKLVSVTVKEVRDANPKCRKCRFVDRCVGGCRNAALHDSGDYYGVDTDLCRFFEDGWDERIRAIAESAYLSYLEKRNDTVAAMK